MAQFGVQSFNGGEANRIRPHLLKPEFAVDTLDADIADGSLRSFRDSKRTSDSIEELDNQNATGTLSVVKFGEEFYKSDNDTGELSSTLGYFGLTPPDSLPEAKPYVPGDRFIGVYKYLVTFATDDGWESAPFRYEEAPIFTTVYSRVVEREILQADVEAFSTTKPVYRKRYGYNAGDRVNYGGKTWECIALLYGTPTSERRQPVRPNQFPGQDGGKYWKDISEVETIVTGYQEIRITDLPTPVEDGVTGYNLYRTIGDGSVFFLVDRIDISDSEYIDTRGDDEILTSRQLNLSKLSYPPVYQANPDGTFTDVGGKYLTEVDEVFYLAVGDRLYLSDQSNPHSWPILNYLELDDEITGIARHKNGVLVFTKNRTYKVTGRAVADIRVEQLPNAQGCSNWRTISYMQNAPVWLSNDGLCRYGFVPDFQAEILQVVTEGLYTFPKGARFAEVANDVYYLFYTDYAICVDFRKARIIYKRSLVADLAAYDKEGDRLLLKQVSGIVSEVDGGDELPFSWTSPEYTLNTVNETKILRAIWLDSTGAITVTAYVNGEEKFSSTSERSGNRPLFFSDSLRGERFQFKIEGTGEFRGFMVEFYRAERGLPFCAT